MTYEETIKYIFDFALMFQNIGTAAYKEGMENSCLIDTHLDYPHKQYKTIHVGGTNGKGSTSHLLASILQEAGYKVGLYTSPHLLDFRERIRVNGELISEEFITGFVRKNKDFFEKIKPSFFELTTGLAFLYFAHEKVDIAVIEVGLGGRLDCTNLISPVLSIITNISLDHTNLLGNTELEIAREKAGIIKENVPVIIGEANEELNNYFSNYRKENRISESAGIIFADQSKIIQSSKLLPSGYWEFDTAKYPELIGELGGLVQEKNAATVLSAIETLIRQGLAIPPKAVYRGFRFVVENTGLQGRWQILQYDPKIVLDTAHNQAGIQYVVEHLNNERYESLHIVLGMVNDKDISAVLNILPKEAVYYFTQPSLPRALPSGELAAKASGFSLKGTIYPTVSEAFYAAKQAASKKDFIFVGGSTFVIADILDTIKKL